jgi:hypothetical protein
VHPQVVIVTIPAITTPHASLAAGFPLINCRERCHQLSSQSTATDEQFAHARNGTPAEEDGSAMVPESRSRAGDGKVLAVVAHLTGRLDGEGQRRRSIEGINRSRCHPPNVQSRLGAHSNGFLRRRFRAVWTRRTDLLRSLASGRQLNETEAASNGCSSNTPQLRYQPGRHAEATLPPDERFPGPGPLATRLLRR